MWASSPVAPHSSHTCALSTGQISWPVTGHRIAWLVKVLYASPLLRQKTHTRTGRSILGGGIRGKRSRGRAAREKGGDITSDSCTPGSIGAQML